MALISNLVSTIADVEGIPEGTVGLIARYAREAGYLSQGGRGRSAARLNVRDCANLLIAVNATGNRMKDIPQTIDTFRNLPLITPWLASEPFDFIGKGGKTFGEALELLLQGFADGSITSFFEEKLKSYVDAELDNVCDRAVKIGPAMAEVLRESAFYNQFNSGPAQFSISFLRPTMFVGLSAGMNKSGKAELFTQAHFLVAIEDLRSGRVPVRKSDREETTVIGYRTLAAVAALLK